MPHGDNHDLWIAPNDPKRMINANDGGANVSINGGESWTAQEYPTAQIYNVFTTDARAVSRLRRAAGQHHRLRAEHRQRRRLYDVGGGESGYIAPDPLDTDVFYAGSYGGLLTRLNRRTGEAARDQRLARQPDGPQLGRHDAALPVDLSRS